jgi:hypothetical protein
MLLKENVGEGKRESEGEAGTIKRSEFGHIKISRRLFTYHTLRFTQIQGTRQARISIYKVQATTLMRTETQTKPINHEDLLNGDRRTKKTHTNTAEFRQDQQREQH